MDQKENEKGEQKREEDQEKQSLFRPSALEHYAASSQFEHNLEPIPYKKWIALASLSLLLIVGIIWAFFGYIPIEAEGVGIVINEGGLSNVESSFSGIVKSLNVKNGDFVKKGELLVSLRNQEIETRLEMVNHTIHSLETRLTILRQQVDIEAKAEKKAISEEIKAAEYNTQSLVKEIPIIEQDVKNKEELVSRGIFDVKSLRTSKELLWSKQRDLEKTKANLKNFEFQFKKGYREEEIQALYEQLLSAIQNRKLLQTRLRYQNIYAPVTGLILELFIQPNQYIPEGTLIARMEIQEIESEKKVIYGYLPIGPSKKVLLNSEVKIELATVNSQEYGALIGNIVNVSQYAISQENLARLINNPILIDYFLQKNESVHEVIIELKEDPSTFSGYAWTSGKGPEIRLTSGTLCTFKGLIEEIHPYLYIFPAWRVKKFIQQH